MDFSNISKQALENAISYKDEHEGSEIIPVHFYNVPAGYSKSGKSFTEYSEIMRNNAKDKFRSIIPTGMENEVDIILDKEDNMAKKIFNYSLRKGVDLIMLGSKGRTKIASFLMGSVAAKLVEMSYNLPILIDKRKGYNLDVIGALKKNRG